MATFAEMVASALDQAADATDAGKRVHRVILDEVKRLDPTVSTSLTGYFNHSYIPDLVVEWKEGGKAVQRPVFLRHSLRSSRASGDLQNLAQADKTALFLSLSQEEPKTETALARKAVAANKQSRTLITTVPAIDELAKPTDGPDPVLGVVKASVIRSAKGVFVEDDVEKLVLPRDRRVEPKDIDAFNAVVARNFSEEAVLRINRVTGIVAQAVATTPTAIQIPESGQLSSTEIRELVPYLLGLRGVTRDREFWSSVARLISFEEIERYWRSFSALDLTPLAAAGAHVWRGTRALLSIRSEAIDDNDFDRTPRWGVTGGTLTAEVGNWRIAFAHAGTKLKTQDRDGSPARWDDLRPALADYTVTGVGLSGVVTQSVYGAVEVADMKDRIDSFILTADDTFHVPSITVNTGVGDNSAAIAADFGERMLQAKPDASLASLTRVALDVLGYRYPTSAVEVEALFDGKAAAPAAGGDAVLDEDELEDMEDVEPDEVDRPDN
jgi:hypothetical protein